MIDLRGPVMQRSWLGSILSGAGGDAYAAATSDGVPTTRKGAVNAGGAAAGAACGAYTAGLAAPVCYAAGAYLMDKVILPAAEAVYAGGKELVYGAEETAAQVAYKESVMAANAAMQAALSARLSPLFLPAEQGRVGALVQWYTVGSFERLQKDMGVWGKTPSNSQWNAYEKALSAFVAPGGERDQQLAARTAAALSEQKAATGYSPPEVVLDAAGVAQPSAATSHAQLAFTALGLIALTFFYFRRRPARKVRRR